MFLNALSQSPLISHWSKRVSIAAYSKPNHLYYHSFYYTFWYYQATCYPVHWVPCAVPYIYNVLLSVDFRYSSGRRRIWENTRNSVVFGIKIVHVSPGSKGAAALDNIEGSCEFFLSGLRVWHVKIDFLEWTDCVNGDDCITVRCHSYSRAQILTVSVSLMIKRQQSCNPYDGTMTTCGWVEGQSMRMYWRLNKTFADPQKNKYYRPGIRFGWRLHLLFFSLH